MSRKPTSKRTPQAQQFFAYPIWIRQMRRSEQPNSADARGGYRHAIDEFVDRFANDRLGCNLVVGEVAQVSFAVFDVFGIRRIINPAVRRSNQSQ
ncbi:MAG: hypothetical protein DMG81_11210 [Acidobacteria bacterium]|nr:MAG: hypothetical protein DMG81_11210 [Acidobacteriota bacterium]